MKDKDIMEIDEVLAARRAHLLREEIRCQNEGRYMDAAGFHAIRDGVQIAMNDIKRYFKNNNRRKK